MGSQDLAWLIPTGLEVLGLAIALGVLGLEYEDAMRKKKPLAEVLAENHRAGWLAAGVAVFALGLCFTKMGWGYKVTALVLGGLMVVLARPSAEKEKAVKQKTAETSGAGRKPKYRYAWLIAGIVVLLVGAWGWHLGWHTLSLVRAVGSVQADPDQVGMENVIPLVGQASSDLRAIHQDLRPLFPMLGIFKALPGIGPLLGQVEPLVTYADSLALAGKEISLGLAPLLEEMHDPQGNTLMLEQLSQVAQTGRDHYLRAEAEVEKADAVRGLIQPELLPDTIRSAYMKLDENFSLLQIGAQMLPSLSTLLGCEKAQHYLILAQNRDELRATGGFISGIGLLTLQQGKIQQFTLGDSYAVDDFTRPYPSPPDALQRFMLADYWVTRDANWSPDFPTTARQAQQLYTLSTGVETQGVIAFNQLAIQAILDVIGPVQLPATEEPVSAQNVENYMRQAWAPRPQEGLSQEWWARRKDFMQLLGNGMVDKILGLTDQDQLVSLAKTVADLLEKGELLLYFNDLAAQRALETSAWDGAIQPGNGDYLYLVDSNVGFNKVDSKVRRSLEYRVDLNNPEQPTGEVTITYQNTASKNVACQQVASYGNGTYQDMQERCYWDYWRIYTPNGTQLVTSNTFPVPAEELLNGQGWSGQVESIPGEAGTQVFAGLLVLPAAQSSQVSISYSLPNEVLQASDAKDLEYSLTIQVQPGLDQLPFRFEVTPPRNASADDPGETWIQSADTTWVWEDELNHTVRLQLIFHLNP